MGKTGPDGQNIFVHTDMLINDKYFCERFKTINQDNSYFYKKTLGYLLTWVRYYLNIYLKFKK